MATPDGDKDKGKKTKSKFVGKKPAAEPKPASNDVDEATLRALGFNETTINHLRRVDEKFESLMVETKKILVSQGIALELQISDGFRTAKQQLKHYLNGASNADGTRNKSEHQKSSAIDFALYENGKLTWDFPKYSTVANAFKRAASNLRYSIEWGGDWKKLKDGVHIEMKGGNAPVSASAYAGKKPARPNCVPCRDQTKPKPAATKKFDLLQELFPPVTLPFQIFKPGGPR